MKGIWKIYLFSFLYGIVIYAHNSLVTTKKISFQIVAYWLGFGETYTTLTYIMFFLLFLFPYIMYIIFMSVYIYRHFCSASVYYFSRNEHRGRWFFKEAFHLLLITFGNVCMLLLGTVFVYFVRGKITWDYLGCVFILHNVVLLTLWLFSYTLLGNLFSILWGNETGVGICCGMLILFTVLFLGVNTKKPGMEDKLLVHLNPNAHVVFWWHKIKVPCEIDMNKIHIPLSFLESYVFLTGLCVCVLVASGIVIAKLDIIEERSE